MKEQTDIKYISNLIWKSYNMISGSLSNYSASQLLLTFVFLRRIDCLIGGYAKESSEFYISNKARFSDEKMSSSLKSLCGGFPYYNVSGLNFDTVLLTGNSIVVSVELYFQGFSDNIQEVLEGMQFRSNMAMLQRQSKYIELLFRTFQDINLSKEVVSDEELLDLIYSLIERMGSVSSYEYATPSSLAKLMTEILFCHLVPTDDQEGNISIYDPVCGMGGLLAKAYFKAVFRLFNPQHISLYGQDINVQTCSIAKAIALIIGNENGAICHGDTLTNDMFPENKFDYILADMPLRLSWKHIKEDIERDSLLSDGRFFAGLPGVNDSQFLFIEHMVSKMSHGSRVIFATTGSILWGGSASSGESRIRRWLFENDHVESIIALPKGAMMPHTPINLYIWVLTNKKAEERKGKTLLINASELGKFSARGSSLDDQTIQGILDSYKNYTENDISKILANDKFGYYEMNYTEEGYKKPKTVKFSLGTKVDEFFSTNVLPFAKGVVTIDYTSVEKGYTVDFHKLFEKTETTDSPSEISKKHIMPLLESLTSFKKMIEDTESIELNNEEDIKEYTSEWVEYPLDYVANIIVGSPKPKNQDGHGLPYLSVNYLRDNDIFVEKYEAPTSEEKVVKESDSILVTKGANAGEVFRGIKGIASNTLSIIRPIENVVLPSFFYYMMKASENKLRKSAVGVAQLSLDSKTIKMMKFLLPPLAAQEKIVAYLDEIDKKVDLANKFIGGTNNVFSSYRQAVVEAAVNGKLKIS